MRLARRRLGHGGVVRVQVRVVADLQRAGGEGRGDLACQFYPLRKLDGTSLVWSCVVPGLVVVVVVVVVYLFPDHILHGRGRHCAESESCNGSIGTRWGAQGAEEGHYSLCVCLSLCVYVYVCLYVCLSGRGGHQRRWDLPVT